MTVDDMLKDARSLETKDLLRLILELGKQAANRTGCICSESSVSHGCSSEVTGVKKGIIQRKPGPTRYFRVNLHFNASAIDGKD